MRKDYFKYLTTAEEDIDWGLYLNVAGRATITPKIWATPYDVLDKKRLLDSKLAENQ